MLDGNFYRTNIIILTDDFRIQMENCVQETQKKIADVIKKFVEEHAPVHLRKKVEDIAGMCLWDEVR